MRPLDGVVTGPRPGSMRDRRGRGHRGPLALPGPVSPAGLPVHRGPRAIFDDVVTKVLASLEQHFAAEPDQVEVVVEDVPLLPPEWDEPVPFSSVTTVADAGGPVSRVVLYRLPLSGRAADRTELVDAVMDEVLHRLAEVWHISPDDLDPR